MIFHFQLSGDRGRETMGTGEGGGNDPLPAALQGLRVLHGGTQPAGSYQYLGAIGVDAGWHAFELGEEGELLKLRQGNGNSIIVRDIEPPDLWHAMDRAVPDWEDRDLFFPPVFI